MSVAAAVAAAEALQGAEVRGFGKELRPLVLKNGVRVAVPRNNRTHLLTEVVDVPVLRLEFAEVPRNASFDATRTEGAANVDVVPRYNIEVAPATDLYFGWEVAAKDQSVSPRVAFHDVLVAA